MSGAGAAGTAILRLLIEAGARDVVVADVEGVIYRDRPGLHESLHALAEATNQRGLTGTLHEAIDGRRRLHRRLRPQRHRRRRRRRGWRRARSSSRSPTRCPRSTRAWPAGTRPSWPPAARTTPTRSTTCWPSPACSGACSTRRRTRSTTRCWSPRPRRSPALVTADELNANYIIPSVFHADVHTAVATRSARGRRRAAGGTLERRTARCLTGHGPRACASVTCWSPPRPCSTRTSSAPSCWSSTSTRTARSAWSSTGPSDVPVREILPDWTDVARHPDVLFQGGPVSTDSALGGRRLDDATASTRTRSRSASGGCTTTSASSTSTRPPRSSRRR